MTSDRQPIWVIPTLDAPAHLPQTIHVLTSRRISYVLIECSAVRERLEIQEPLAAIVHGGPVSPLLLEVQRWLIEFAVPTLLMIDNLSEAYEASLIDRGAQDALRLPASPRVLGSRIQALLRSVPLMVRERHLEPRILSNSVVVDPGRRVVEIHGEDLRLTRSQFDIFLVLARRAGRVVTRQEIAEEVGHSQMSGRSLESHVSRLRLRLQEAGESPTALRSVRGVGYVLDLAPENADRSLLPKSKVRHPNDSGTR